MECFGLKMSANAVFVFERTFRYGYVKFIARQKLTQFPRKHPESESARLQRNVIRYVHYLQLGRNTSGVQS